MVPVGSLLLGYQESPVTRSVLLRGLVSSNPEVAGHAADALARAGRFDLLRDSRGRGQTAAVLVEGPGWAGAPWWADSASLL